MNYGGSEGKPMQERTLTVINYGEAIDKMPKTRITIPPSMVTSIIASEKPTQKSGGDEQHKVNVLLVDGNQLEIFITSLDLTTLERAIGSYFLP